jgi:hypothetical protein
MDRRIQGLDDHGDDGRRPQGQSCELEPERALDAVFEPVVADFYSSQHGSTVRFHGQLTYDVVRSSANTAKT